MRGSSSLTSRGAVQPVATKHDVFDTPRPNVIRYLLTLFLRCAGKQPLYCFLFSYQNTGKIARLCCSCPSLCSLSIPQGTWRKPLQWPGQIHPRLVARVDGGSEKYVSRLLIKWDNKGRIESRKNIEEGVVTCILN